MEGIINITSVTGEKLHIWINAVQSIHCFIDLELPREEHNICISPPSEGFYTQMSELAECVKPQPAPKGPHL